MTAPIRVLHVDDDPAFSDLVATFLPRVSDRIEVVTANGADEGIATLATTDVDCVVSDYDMPETNGIEFLEAVREEFDDLPFVLFTGKGSEEIASEAISRGVTDYLQKETGTDQYTVLANRIENVVEGYHSRRDLEQSRKRLSLLFEKSPLGAIEWNSRFEIVRLNDRAETILGYDESELQGASWEVLVPASDREAVRRTTESLLRAEGGVHRINRNLRKDGERITCEWHNRVVTDENGDVVAVLSMFRDVSERIERERKLDRLRDRSREIMFTRTKAETADVAVAAADDIIEAPLTGFHLVDDAGETLVPAAVVDQVHDAFSAPPAYERNGPPGSRSALAWDVFESGTARRIDDVAACEELTEETPAGSVIIRPIGDHGIFIISAPNPEAFTDTDEVLAEILAGTVATTMDRVAREETLRERERRLGLLHEATRDLIRAETAEEIATRGVEAADSVLGFSIALVRLYDPDVGGLVPVAIGEDVEKFLPERETFFPEDGTLNWEAYEADERRVYDDIRSDHDAVDSGTSLRSLMLFPLGDHGTLSVGEVEPDAFDDTDRYLAHILATAIETALDAAERESESDRRR